MFKHRSIIVLLSIILVLAFSVAGISYGGTPLSDKLSDIKSNIKETKNDLKEGKEQEKQIKSEIEDLVADMNANQEKIDAVLADFNKTTNDIAVVTKELEELQDDIDKQTEGLNKRLRSMYMNDSTSFIDVVLNSGSISELLTNVELIKRIHKSDKEVLAELEANHKKVEKKKNELKSLQASLQSQKDTLDAKNAQMTADKKTLDDKKAQIHEKNEEMEENLDAMEAESAAITARLLAAQKKAEEERKAQQAQQAQQGNGNNSKPFVSGTSASGFGWPVNGIITSNFGWRSSGFHGGLDIGVPTGTAVHASKSGYVFEVGHWDGHSTWGMQSYGNYVIIDHRDGTATLYAHNSSIACSTGQEVSKGQVIAYSGSTGNSSGPHCHFEVRINGARVNPLGYLP